MKIIYPTIKTTSSPKATVKTFSQNGAWIMKYNSAPTTNPFIIVGITIAKAKCFKKQTHKQDKRVANVPNKISQGNNGDNKLAIKHPKVTPKM